MDAQADLRLCCLNMFLMMPLILYMYSMYSPGFFHQPAHPYGQWGSMKETKISYSAAETP